MGDYGRLSSTVVQGGVLIDSDCRYLTDSGDVNMKGVQQIMIGLGSVEDEIFKRRQVRQMYFYLF